MTTKYLRYSGEFLSRKGVEWRVEIWQDSDEPFEVGELTFPGDGCLVFEWPNSGKEDTVCGSTATLRIESPGDRTYEDLYTIRTGAIQLRAYREGVLYWSGCLDPEFYEEPYECAEHYDVSLTFSDLGELDRINFDMSGMLTLEQVVTEALRRVGLEGYDETYISTSIAPGEHPMSLADLKVRADNFYDEDDEPSTFKEVLEGILEPLALKIMQRAGRVYLFDMNALYESASRRKLEWNGDSQTLGTDVVYNNAKITWSPYADVDDLLTEECWPEDVEIDEDVINLNSQDPKEVNGCQVWTYHHSTDWEDLSDLTDAGFSLWTYPYARPGTITLNTSGSLYEPRIFKTVPQFDGSESEGIAFCWPGVGYDAEKKKNDPKQFGLPVSNMNRLPQVPIIESCFETESFWIPPVDAGSRLYLRVVMEMLLDVRYNFNQSAVRWRHDDDQDSYTEWFDMWANFVYIPVNIYFKPDGSDETYIWTNADIVHLDPNHYKPYALASTVGQWVNEKEYDTAKGKPGYLAYYDKSDRSGKSGSQGWKKNRPAINPHNGSLQSLLLNCEDGQYIPYPESASGGKVFMRVYSGWLLATVGFPTSKGAVDRYTGDPQNSKLWSDVHWAMVKMPQVEIMNAGSTQGHRGASGGRMISSIEPDDVEYSAEINPDAKEDIEIDTICGTSADGVPTARGAYFNAATGAQVKELTRAGRTTQVENLLCGTLFSQFGQRRTTLSGDADILAHPLCVYTEQNQGDRIFLITDESQDVIEDTSDVTITELRPDEYVDKN